MPDSFLGDHLVLEEMLPMAWTALPPVEPLVLARLNADNHQLLGAESSFDEVRVHEALKDESPALVHELQRLEFKLNVLLRLTAELCVRHSALPPRQSIRLSSVGLEWFGIDLPAVGMTGVAEIYINPALPQALKLPCVVAGERLAGPKRAAQLRFTGLSDPVVELIEKLIFRRHRRLVAGARQAAP
jgi:hypothetical protein